MSRQDPKSDEVGLHQLLVLDDPDVNRILDGEAAEARAQRLKLAVDANPMLSAAIAAHRDTLRDVPPAAGPASEALRPHSEVERVTRKIAHPVATAAGTLGAAPALGEPPKASQATQRELPRFEGEVGGDVAPSLMATPSPWRTQRGLTLLGGVTLAVGLALLVLMLRGRGDETAKGEEQRNPVASAAAVVTAQTTAMPSTPPSSTSATPAPSASVVPSEAAPVRIAPATPSEASLPKKLPPKSTPSSDAPAGTGTEKSPPGGKPIF